MHAHVVTFALSFSSISSIARRYNLGKTQLDQKLFLSQANWNQIVQSMIESSPPQKPDEVVAASTPEHKEHATYEETGKALPEGYFKGKYYVGTLIGAGFASLSGVGGFSFVAPILNILNEDLGPDKNYVWISLVYTLMVSIGYSIVGRLSDIFGRRWFFICGNIFALVGDIVCATAINIPTIIGGTVIIGLAAAVQLSFLSMLGELTPIKHRFLVNAFMYVWIAVPAGFGPAISYAFVLHTAAGWRWCYYFLIIINALSAALYYFFYYPPNFHMKQRNHTRWDLIKKFDFLGLFLYTAGITLFLLGISWGGSVHPWKSASVIATTVIGGLTTVAFVFWELRRDLEEPLMPPRVLKHFGWTCTTLVSGCVTATFYGLSIIFPQMVFGVYTSDLAYGSILCLVFSVPYIFGDVAAGLARYVTQVKWQLVVCLVISTSLIAANACATVDNKTTIICLTVIGGFFLGYSEGISLTLCSVFITDQADIGTAVGAAGTGRFMIATLGVSIYTAVLNSRTAKTIPEKVPAALIQAGLPPSSITTFIAAISTGSFDKVPGVTPQIIIAGIRAYREALVSAFNTAWLTTMAFACLAILFAVLCPPSDSLLTNSVVATLHQKEDSILDAEDVSVEPKSEDNSV